MKYYCAPMEGVNVALYRNIHKEIFNGVDKYFAPFIVPNDGMKSKTRQLQDIWPERNQDIKVIPQIMTNKSDDFIRTAKEMKELGYDEVNLNLGCPSGTVVSKKRGSGFLAYPDDLDRFLYQIFEKAESKISVKTRLGVEEPEEFYKLFEIFNQYDMEELIVHPRTRKDMYKLPPNGVVLGEVINQSKNRICYNGDVFTSDAFEQVKEKYPSVDAVMFGRGVIANPALIREVEEQRVLQKWELRLLHDKILEAYEERLSGETHVLYRMKEYWYYMIHSFLHHKYYGKKIKKTQKLCAYKELIKEVFGELEVGGHFQPYKTIEEKEENIWFEGTAN